MSSSVPGAVRISVVLVAAAGLAMLAAACGGSPSSHVAELGSTTTTQVSISSSTAATAAQASRALAFARCMRAHRLPNWPDPSSGGVFDKSKLTPQELGAGSSQLQEAQAACNHLLSGGRDASLARVQQERAQGLEFSQCVRSHGVPRFPDPASDGRIPDPAAVGINQGSPKFEAANHACRKYRPPYMPSNAAYNAYARTHEG